MQAPPRDAKRARQLSPSVVATTPAQYLVRHRCGRATPRRTLWSCHWSRPATAHWPRFSRGHSSLLPTTPPADS